VRGVEKPATEEPSGQRFLQWVVRYLSWTRSGGFQLVEITGFSTPAVALVLLPGRAVVSGQP
jgi:hypothetical protein